jgi:hypothetical protein
LVKQEAKLLAGEFKVLVSLCADKMPGSKVFDKYWVDGTCKRTFRKSIYAQMLVKKLQCMPLGETSALEA